MKLIIDIPEGDYAPFKFGKYIIVGGLRGNGKTLMSAIYKAVANGTPLEKHDEEIIKETVESIWGKSPCDDAIRRQAVIDALCDRCDLFHRNGEQTCLTKCEEYHFLATLPPVYPQNTDVLDKIRADIEQVAEEESKHDRKWSQGLKYALKIIDKYRGKQNE